MYILRAEHSFDSAHFLSGYEGKCANIHGHRWRIVAEVAGEKLASEGQLRGMVIDFGDLKRDVKKMVDDHDHALIIETGTMREVTLNCLREDGFNIIEIPFRPTAEEFSRYFYEILEEKGYQVKRVTVYETPTNCATYERGR
ncbi:6-carboxytetrahydropterin synthase QueD [Propionigenium maris DSM 9537]|uniref:6-carboxy-5,6,7,8-tetrahydropterin synthase n=1 Tax=Propionigenium maris DSM 9537 TaxID=1123000 RepID=A0A9W6GN77_9FUSO|nr:6-carboxytetrahydropterin synthase QueD [Propionigenium maris]GLI57205.1 6-carboxytetrahydropterin synthase QueD [Propionigenium maris DSM 9537]